MRQKNIAIIGGGIVGLMTAYLIRKLLPNTLLTIIDAGGDPRVEADLYSTTFGQGSDARQFTGTESLSYQNPIHSRALRLSPGEHKKWAGWKLINEEKLTPSERRWRSESAYRFVNVGHTNLNNYDLQHTKLNFAGMELWNFLRSNKKINDSCINDDCVYVLFQSKDAFMADSDSESQFDPLKRASVAKTNILSHNLSNIFEENKVFPKCLRLAGSAWRIKSLGSYILSELEKDQQVKIIWHKIVKSTNDMHQADAIIWTVGTTHLLPDIYRKYSHVQGIAGCWLTTPNKGFNALFKVSLPQPSGYINITPDSESLHISGGFGWTGELSFYEAAALMEPIKEHFLTQIATLFKIPVEKLRNDREYPFGICVRPSTPTGLPDARNIELNGVRHIFISGSGKSGSTQAPILALFTTSSLMSSNELVLDLPYFTSMDTTKRKIVQDGLNEMFALSKEERKYTDTTYPQLLEKDLFPT